MPNYCFRHGKKVVTRAFRIAERPAFIVIGDVRYERSLADERPGVPSTRGWPVVCEASAVAPSQAGALREYYAKAGVPTEVTADGQPVYRDAAHRRKALKARGFVDRAGYL